MKTSSRTRRLAFAAALLSSPGLAEESPLSQAAERVSAAVGRSAIPSVPSLSAAPAGVQGQPVSSADKGYLSIGCGQRTFFLESDPVGAQSDCQQSLFYQDQNIRLSLSHQTNSYDKGITDSFGRNKGESRFSLRAKVLPWAKLSAVLLSQEDSDGNRYDAEGFYLDLQKGSPFSSAPRLTVGTETDSDQSDLKIAYVRQKAGDMASTRATPPISSFSTGRTPRGPTPAPAGPSRPCCRATRP